MAPILFVLLSVLVATPVFAQTGSCVQLGTFTSCTDSSGRQSTIVDLGNGFQSYSDNRGNSGSIVDIGPNFKQYNITPGTAPALPPPVFSSPPGSHMPSAPMMPGLPAMPAMPAMPGLAPMPGMPGLPSTPPAPPLPFGGQ